jgi:hypothetical protein
MKQKKEDNDAGLLQSNIWTTLFRGGFTNNGKLQRSLSGHHVSRSRVHCLNYSAALYDFWYV